MQLPKMMSNIYQPTEFTEKLTNEIELTLEERSYLLKAKVKENELKIQELQKNLPSLQNKVNSILINHQQRKALRFNLFIFLLCIMIMLIVFIFLKTK